MFVAVITFSVRPGGTPAAKAQLKAAQAVLPAQLAAAALTFSVEIGEVNTLVCLHPLADLAELQTLSGWACQAAQSHLGELLRGSSLNLFQSDASTAQLAQLGAGSAILLQAFRSALEGTAAGQARLAPVTGPLAEHWLLSVLEQPDQALALGEKALDNTHNELLRSCLLDPMH